MASGKKNYFRHSFFAFEDEKIQSAIDLLGMEGYAYYFIILELLARKCENEFINPITIHQQTLRNVLRKKTKSCNKVLTKLQQSGLFVITFNESLVEFDIPNLSKYMGYYTTKSSPNVSKEKKVKEKKVKESKTESEIPQIVHDVINYLNESLNKKYRVGNKKTIALINARHKENFILQDFKKVIDIKISQWSKDEKMKNYLRPETLFGNKFESYLQEEKIPNSEDIEKMLINLTKPRKENTEGTC